MTFLHKLKKIVKKNNSLVCVGLDTNIEKIPKKFLYKKFPLFEFNKAIIDQTSDLVCSYKPNNTFYEALGTHGIEQLKMTMDYLKNSYPEVVTIIDAKRADIGTSNEGYVKFMFDYLEADSITLHPYFGGEALEPFLKRRDKACIILCRTSNPGAGEFQDLKNNGKPLYEIVAQKVLKNWNKNNNCLLVIGATYPHELKEIREITGDNMWFLIPGIGAQGGDIEQTVKNGQDSKGLGIIISASRSIIFANNPRQAALTLKNEINKYRSYDKRKSN